MIEKLNETTIKELLKLRDDKSLFHRESQYLEFKESFNLAGLADYYRDFAAFANNKGGYIIYGVKDKPRRMLSGIKPRARDQFDKLDPEIVTGHLLDIFSGNIVWKHEIYTIKSLTFAAFFIQESVNKPIICKKNEGRDQILKNGEIYFRYGGRTQKIQFSELENIINNRIEQNNSQWLDLFQKIGKAGPQNAAILDTERGLIEKKDSQILMVDEDLVKNIQWIKEGEFSEKEGERTLKLVGSVHPIDSIEVVKKVKENRLKLYPLTAKEVIAEIKRKKPDIKQQRIYGIISENELKSNTAYSSYVFRSNKQEEHYEKEGIVLKGIPSIYKPSIIDFIINIHENEL
jgi:hypothetical protein